MSKYYTPEIEEFHAGFEYELVPSIGYTIINFGNPDEKQETQWATEYKKGIFGIKDVDPFGSLLSTINAGIKNKKCRVKYLDKKDIDSLGFKYDKTSKEGQWKFYKDNICLFYRPKTKELGTFTIDANKSDYMVKYVVDNKHVSLLIIKNKSELKKLLKQLDII